MEVFWRLGVSQIRFQKTLAAPYAGGDVTVRTLTIEKQPQGYRVRDATARDTFRRGSAEDDHSVVEGRVEEFTSLEKALEAAERLMDRS